MFFLFFYTSHTLLDGTITFDVDDVASFVDVHVGGQAWHTLVPKSFREHVSGSSSFTVSVRHLRRCLVFSKSRKLELKLNLNF